MTDTDSGRVGAAEQALVNEAPAGLHPSGFDPSRFTMDWVGGNCPVQAEGSVDGHPFYFRARGDGWEFWVGEPWTSDAFTISGSYGVWPDAGWMSVETAKCFIFAGVCAFRDLGLPTTQGMETRQGGDGTAPSRSDDSPVVADDAPYNTLHPHPEGSSH